MFGSEILNDDSYWVPLTKTKRPTRCFKSKIYLAYSLYLAPREDLFISGPLRGGVLEGEGA